MKPQVLLVLQLQIQILAPLKEQQFKVECRLSNSNPTIHQDITPFAPTNDAFAKLGLVDAGSLGACKIVS
jgi:hypothetical protein